MRYGRLNITVLLILFGSVKALAQGQQLPDSLRFTVRKEYVPVARDATRITEEPKLLTDTAPPAPMRYDVLPKQANTILRVDTIQPAKLTNEPLEKINAGHARIGFGNYTMPLIEVGYGTVRNKKYVASGLARYHASYATLDGRPFGFTDIDLKAQGSYFLKDHTFHAALNYAHDRNFYYGYNVNDTAFANTDLVQFFHRGGVNLSIASTDALKPKMLTFGQLKYHYTGDHFSSYEHAVSAATVLTFPIKKVTMLANVSGAYYLNSMPSGQRNSGIVTLGPEFRTTRERWALALGINLGLDINDTTVGVTAFPKLDFHYFLVKDIWRLYASATGGIQRNGLNELATKNPWMQTDQRLQNTWERLRLLAGFKGTIIKRVTYDVGISETIAGNAVFFVNDLSDGVGNKFLIEYHDVNIFGINGELGFLWGQRLTSAAKAEYRFFTMPNNNIQPWHEAPFRFTFSGRYNIKDKIIIKAEIYAMGTRVAKGQKLENDGSTSLKIINLAGYADVSLGAEYRYRKWIGAFIDLRNIAALRYQQFNQYPSQRFSFMAGLNFNF